MKTFDDNFIIALKTKKLVLNIYNLMENIPRKDYFLKDKINKLTFDLLEKIYIVNYSLDNFKLYYYKIRKNIALLDFLLEILSKKQYISLKQLEKEIYLLTEINKMSAKWISNRTKTDA